MTLSRFLLRNVYIPLGGNRKGTAQRYINLMVTMLLGGLWHGAGWTFVIWGGLHGMYLVINHGWRSLCRLLGRDLSLGPPTGVPRLLTFVSVIVGWTLFRAESFGTAMRMLRSMVGFNGISLPTRLSGHLGGFENWLTSHGFAFVGMFPNVSDWNNQGILWLLVLLVVVWYVPNTQQLLYLYRPALDTYPDLDEQYRKPRLFWRPTLVWSLATAILAVVSILSLTQISEFLYFQF